MTILFAGQQLGSGPSNQVSLIGRLTPSELQTLRGIFKSIPNPPDSPRVLDVLVGSQRCLAEFTNCLINPNDVYKALVAKVDELVRATQTILADYDLEGEALDRPMQRRIRAFPAWSLFMMLGRCEPDHDILRCAGAELAIKLNGDKCFAENFADNLRIAIGSENKTIADANRQLAIFRRHEKLWREAVMTFEASPEPPPEQAFESRARQYILRNMTYASPRHRQGVFDRKCLSDLQMMQSAKHLMSCVVTGDDNAIQIMMAFLTGLSPQLATSLPLADHVCDDWLMLIDLKVGVIKTNIAPIFPNSASPSPGAETAHRPANKIIVKPLPQFLASALRKRLEEKADAKSLGDLLQTAGATGRTRTSASASTVMPASVRRFLNGGSAFAIQVAGIDRLAAAILLNDFSVIPGARMYYSLIARMEIWEASQTFFTAIGWDEPTAFVDGLPVGSCVVPTPQAVATLFNWMSRSVANCSVGKRYSYTSVVAFHNEFVRYCATLAAFSLCARSAEEFDLTAASLTENRAYVLMLDKRTGPFPGYLPVPLNKILAEQIRRLHQHYRALLERLVKLDAPRSDRLISYIRKIVERKPTPLFFLIDRGRPVPIGSSHLVSWWPIPLKFHGNFGRDFWETELRLMRISAPQIDMLVRHQLNGVESHTSTSTLPLTQWCNDSSAAQVSTLRDLGVVPLYGLGKRQGRAVGHHD